MTNPLALTLLSILGYWLIIIPLFFMLLIWALIAVIRLPRLIKKQSQQNRDFQNALLERLEKLEQTQLKPEASE